MYVFSWQVFIKNLLRKGRYSDKVVEEIPRKGGGQNISTGSKIVWNAEGPGGWACGQPPIPESGRAAVLPDPEAARGPPGA